jgi:peptidoglycan hydrolase-like protein with peptidoglycan-binding domain
MAISSQDYIKWVQRGLNRIVEAELICNGLITSQYRDAVKTFQSENGLTPKGDIGPSDQNKLIRINHETPIYVEWVQNVLTDRSVGISLPKTGTMNKDTKAAVRSFQAYHGLKDDGWVGVRTETQMIRTSGLLPFGQITGGGPVTPKPKPAVRPKPTPGGIPLDSQVTLMINHAYHHALYNRGSYAAASRKRLICVLGKLRRRSGINDTFLLESPMLSAYLSSSAATSLKAVKDTAREFLTRRLQAIPAANRSDRVTWRIITRDLIQAIEAGLRFVHRHDSGLFAKSRNPGFPAFLSDAVSFLETNKSRQSSIISCFADSAWL